MDVTADKSQRRLKTSVSVQGTVRRLLRYRRISDTLAALALVRGLELSTPAELLRWSTNSFGALSLKPATVEALRHYQAVSASMNLGFSPLCVVAVIPLSMPAQASGKTALLDALQWTAERVARGERPTGELPAGQDLSVDYLHRLWSLAQVSPWVCAVTMGVEVAFAKALCTPDSDRLTREVFLRHFSLRLRFRGSKEVLGDDGCSRVEASFRDYILARDGGSRPCKLALLGAMFGYRPAGRRTLQQLSDEDAVDVAGRLSEIFVELRLTEMTMTRLLTPILLNETIARKLARSLRWRICSMVTEKKRRHAPTPHGEVKEVLLQMVRSMILDALGSNYTVEDVVEVFIVVSLLCLRSLAIDLVSGREEFWIPWFEKQLYPFLETLTGSKLTEEKLCGERKSLSAKSNL